jgi:hypothetical protein
MDLDLAGLTAALGRAEQGRMTGYRRDAVAGAKQAVAAAGSLAAAMASAGRPVK